MLTNKAVSLVTFEHGPIISECQQTTTHEKKKKRHICFTKASSFANAE
jgi:hypothetical protein